MSFRFIVSLLLLSIVLVDAKYVNTFYTSLHFQADTVDDGKWITVGYKSDDQNGGACWIMDENGVSLC